VKKVKKFSRKIEDFTCLHCGSGVVGNGYTNHCPHCLWSQCVDINPGDRALDCGGLMAPIAVETAGDTFIIIHKCEKCGKERRQKSNPNDNFEEILKISADGIATFTGKK
jgi:hypothetical protein